MEITLNSVYKFEGESFEKIKIPVDTLNGDQLIKIQKDYKKLLTNNTARAAAENLTLLAGNAEFQVFLASSLTKKPMDFFTGLPAKDFLNLSMTLTSFLLA